MREYRLYSAYPGGSFTTRVGKYYEAPKSSRSIYDVRAASIKQAYYLAGNEIWADGPNDVGLIKRLLGSDHDNWERADYLEEREAGVR